MKKYFVILFTLILSVSVIVVLSWLSFDVNQNPNGFNRIILPDPLTLVSTLDMYSDSYYIAGISNNNVYLGNQSILPPHLIVSNIFKPDTLHVNVETMESINWKYSQLTVDSPYFYIADRSTHKLLYGELSKLKANSYTYDSVSFTKSVPISKSLFAIRTLSNRQEYELGIEKDYPPFFKRGENLLDKQLDGIFCTDGMLLYDNAIAMVVYLYYYRNQFICMDTNLNLLSKGSTIDTVSQVQIKTATIESEHASTFGSPPFLVNRKCCVSEGFLFVNSNLVADNEDRKQFNRSSIIDVYSLRDRRYKFSFYIPDYRENKILDLQIKSASTLAVIYDRYLIIYSISPQLKFI